jgi:hypothetical protein
VLKAADDRSDDAAHHLPLLPIAVAGQCLPRLDDDSFQPLQLRPPAEHALLERLEARPKFLDLLTQRLHCRLAALGTDNKLSWERPTYLWVIMAGDRERAWQGLGLIGFPRDMQFER